MHIKDAILHSICSDAIIEFVLCRFFCHQVLQLICIFLLHFGCTMDASICSVATIFNQKLIAVYVLKVILQGMGVFQPLGENKPKIRISGGEVLVACKGGQLA